MCPLYPVHLVLMYGALLVCVWVAGLGTLVGAVSRASSLGVRLNLNNTPAYALSVAEGHQETVTFYIDDLPPQAAGDILIEVGRAWSWVWWESSFHSCVYRCG